MVDTQFGRPDSDRVVTIHNRLPDGSLRPGSSGRPSEAGAGRAAAAGCIRRPPTTSKFLAMLVRGGDGLLRPETVAGMGQNQIGTLDVSRMQTVMPPVSNDAEFFPGMVKGWGYGFVINSQPGHAGRAANSLAWAGLGQLLLLDRSRPASVAGRADDADPAISPIPGSCRCSMRFESAIYARALS